MYGDASIPAHDRQTKPFQAMVMLIELMRASHGLGIVWHGRHDPVSLCGRDTLMTIHTARRPSADLGCPEDLASAYVRPGGGIKSGFFAPDSDTPA